MLCLGALFVLLHGVWRYGVDVPVWDAWSMVPIFEKWYQNTLTWPDIWAQHNEHRLVLPRLVFLALGVASGWDTRWEMAASVLTALLAWMIAVAQVLHGRARYGRTTPWLCVGLAWLFFSLRQHENWLWGFQLQWYMNLLAVTLGAWLFSRPKLTPGLLAGQALCAALAMLSMGGGAAYWLATLALLLLRALDPAQRRRALRYAGFWTVLFVAFLAWYLHGYATPGHHAGVGALAKSPTDVVRYLLLFVAGILSPMATESWLWVAVGGLGLCGLGLFFRPAFRILPFSAPRSEQEEPDWFFLLLGLYGLGCALMTALGRAGFGVWQASSSRYATTSMLIWSAVLAMLAAQGPRLWRRGGQARRLSIACGLAAVLMVGASFWRGQASLPYMAYSRQVYGEGRIALRQGGPAQRLENVSWDPAWIIEQAIPLLIRYRLSVFRDENADERKPTQR